jgi:transposase
MLRPDFSKWEQSLEDIRRLSIEAEQPRSRERFQALYQIGSQQSNATEWAGKIGRNPRTVMDWVRRYNSLGPTSLEYRHTGGRTPLLPNQSK